MRNEHNHQSNQRSQIKMFTIDLQSSKQIQSQASNNLYKLGLEKQTKLNNNLLQLRNKFTLQTEPIYDQPTADNLYKTSKRTPSFRKYVDLVVQNRRLCRRGPFDLPLPWQIAPTRRKPAKTDTGLSQQQLAKQKRLKTSGLTNHSGLKLSWENIKGLQEIEKKQLPSLGSMRYGRRQLVPIKVQKYISKSLTQRCKLSQQQSDKLKQNIMQRKVDVELINYGLLAKLIND